MHDEFTPAMRCEIVREIRVVLVRHLIDIGRLQISISMRGIHLRGYLSRLPGTTMRLTPTMVEAIIHELGRIRHVRRVITDFDNWKQTEALGQWEDREAGQTIAGAVDQLGKRDTIVITPTDLPSANSSSTT